jgi:methyl-accepting chemotaxis protein
MQHLSVATRIYLVISLCAVFFLAVITFLLYQANRHTARYEDLLAAEVHQQDEARVMQVTFKKEVQEWKDILLRGDNPDDLKKYRKNFFEMEAEVRQHAEDLKPLVKDPAARDLLSKFLIAHEELGRGYRAALDEYTKGNGHDFKTADRMVRGQDRPPTDLIDQIVKALEQRVKDVRKEQQEAVVTERWVIGASAAAALVCVLFAGFVIVRSITRPLRQTMGVLEQVARGDLTSQLDVAGSDEVARMGHGLNQAIDALRKAAEQERQQAERERRQAEELKEKVDSLLTVVDAAATGDLTRPVAVQGKDAIGQLGEGLAQFLGSLRGNVTNIAHTAESLAGSSRQLSAVSQQMAANAEETATQANVVSAAAQQVSRSVSSVSAAADEMGSSIKEIARSAVEAARIATSAVEAAAKTNATVSRLGDSSTEIGNVVEVITSIAQQTNLLALNATIEAARAGEAGKGFAVVATEVKELAKQTAKATDEIGRKIEAIQGDTKGAVDAIGRIGEIINQINDIQNTIAAAVEQQTATTGAIGRNVAEAARGSSEIAHNISGVADAARSTTEGASNTQVSADELSRMAQDMQKLVAQFKY